LTTQGCNSEGIYDHLRTTYALPLGLRCGQPFRILTEAKRVYHCPFIAPGELEFALDYLSWSFPVKDEVVEFLKWMRERKKNRKG
jgi:hypothetical protein